MRGTPDEEMLIWAATAEALGTTPELWLNLQTGFRLFEARSAAERAPSPSPSPVVRRARLRGLVPLSTAKARGWLPDTDDLDRLEAAACELVELPNLDERPSFARAARRSNSSESITSEQVAWLARVRFIGRARRSASTFDRSTLVALARELPKRTASGPSTLRRVPDH